MKKSEDSSDEEFAACDPLWRLPSSVQWATCFYQQREGSKEENLGGKKKPQNQQPPAKALNILELASPLDRLRSRSFAIVRNNCE